MRVEIVHEVIDDKLEDKESWKLCFQWCKYNYDDDPHEEGYRFIWRKPDGSLQPARGKPVSHQFAQLRS